MRLILSRSFLKAIVATTLVVVLFGVSEAQMMQSTNYKMQSDSVNVGGLFSTSTNYRMEDTVGEIATGNSNSANYVLRAGYQQMQSSFISLSAIPDVVLAPNLGGVLGGTATGSTAFVVITDNAAGYSVTINATTSPAMRSGTNTIADYVPAGAVPDFLFTTSATNSHFAYSPEGVDISVRLQDAGSVCGVAGSDTANRCYDGLRTTPVEIARRGSSNQPSGSTTTVRFTVGIGGNVTVPEGVYRATTTITALTL